ncbi:MAG: FtsX-like permease family protein, partial [Gammaproteobacteria bacterium]|nr:FtsX-like permease family protein [Gammaproteobacteria bacterium]
NSALNVIPDLYIERLIVILDNNIHTQEDLDMLKNNIERISPGIQIFIQNFSSMYETTQTISMQFNLFLTLVSFISLLIGGVGIMNIMLVIVTERQSEIGLRMAIGAKRSQIIYLFLIESVVICLLGGLTGIVLAIPILYGITLMMRVSFMFFSKTVMIGFTIPIIIGLFFGMFPAIKAARMDPIKALNS